MAWIGAAASIVGGMMASDAQSSAASDAASKSAEASKYAADIQKQMYDQTRTDQTPWRNTGVASLNRLSQLMGLTGSSGSVSSGANGLTDAQLRAQFLPQYTSTSNSPLKWVGDSTVDAGEGTSTNPARGSWVGGPSSIVDENGLAAAIANARSGSSGIQTDQNAADYGSLLKPFSMADFQQDPGYAFRVSEGQRGLDNSAAARGGLQSGNALKAAARYGQDMGSQEYGNAYNRFNTNQTNQFNRLSSVAGLGQTANNALASAGANYANQAGNYSMVNGANQAGAALSGGNSRASSWTGLGKALGGINWGGSTTGSDPWSGSYDAFNNPDNYG